MFYCYIVKLPTIRHGRRLIAVNSQLKNVYMHFLTVNAVCSAMIHLDMYGPAVTFLTGIASPASKESKVEKNLLQSD